MDGLRILVVNEPRAYRETIAAALGCLRPADEVVDVDPRWTAAEMARFRPHLVIASDETLIERANALAWVLLYPGGSGRVTVCVGGQHETLPDLPFNELIAIVERVERVALVRQTALAG